MRIEFLVRVKPLQKQKEESVELSIQEEFITQVLFRIADSLREKRISVNVENEKREFKIDVNEYNTDQPFFVTLEGYEESDEEGYGEEDIDFWADKE